MDCIAATLAEPICEAQRYWLIQWFNYCNLYVPGFRTMWEQENEDNA
jgi:hypothetical protein